MSRRTLSTLPILVFLAGCNNLGSSADMGVTPGGSQDIELARSLIEEGQVPSREHFTAEGLFSEHDLPLDGAPCEQSLCPRAAASIVNPVDGSGAQVLVQLGFGTNIQEDTFERSALDVAVALDISCSMQGSMPALKHAFRELVDQMDENDRMSIVTYGTVARVHERLRAMDAGGKERMLDAIKDLDDGGSTNMEEGMSKAIEQLQDASDREDVSKRVMLFTDVQPNTGATGEDTFLGIVRDAADDDIGMTLFGIGLHMGSELAEEMSEVRGGNSVFLSGSEKIKQVFDELDTLVTPIAYNLDVAVSAAQELSFRRAIGAPLDEESGQVEMGASTLFLSRRQGGIGALLEIEISEELPLPEQPWEIASFQISYESLDGEIIEEELSLSWDGGSIHGQRLTKADQLGVYKMGGLVDEILALEAAADWCSGQIDQQKALSRIHAATESVAGIVLDLEDSDLSEEVGLLKQLELNVQSGEEACVPADLYYY